jgi:hypothetical protein
MRINFTLGNIPGVETSRPNNDSGLITSDSNIEPDIEAKEVNTSKPKHQPFESKKKNFNRNSITTKFK